MDEQTILLCCAFGIPLVVIALIIGAVGFILRRVRPDLYMSEEEKREAEKRLWAEMNGIEYDKNKDKQDKEKE
jgi:hypothetical protein